MSARDSIEVFEAHRVLAWYDEKMASYGGVQGNEAHNGLVVVVEACFRLAGDDSCRLRLGHGAGGASQPDLCQQGSRCRGL